MTYHNNFGIATHFSIKQKYLTVFDGIIIELFKQKGVTESVIFCDLSIRRISQILGNLYRTIHLMNNELSNFQNQEKHFEQEKSKLQSIILFYYIRVQKDEDR